MTQPSSTERPNTSRFTTNFGYWYLASWCFGTIGATLGTKALVKYNYERVNKVVPRPTIFNINAQDAYILGFLATTACLLIVTFTAPFLCMKICRPQSFRELFFHPVLLISTSVWLFAAIVPLTDFQARHQVQHQ